MSRRIDKRVVWLASYPRSGNTFLRTVLWQCFELRSASIYENDLGGNKELEVYTGHIEHGPNHEIIFPKNSIPLVKTHKLDSDSEPAIYVIRDGRAASVSLWKFLRKRTSLQAVIEGQQHSFGTWSNHIRSWNPWERPNTLLLRYEDMINDLPGVLHSISEFLQCDILKDEVPDRNAIVTSGGRWVREKSDWRAELTGVDLDRFYQINRDVLLKCNYLE